LNGWQLQNNLIADDRLAMDLAARLAADPRTAVANVRFEVFLGVAYLGGTVNSPEQRAAALELAGHTPGVVQVQDRLTIVR
jgi:osmotically-inducible protein OsmY